MFCAKMFFINQTKKICINFKLLSGFEDCLLIYGQGRIDAFMQHYYGWIRRGDGFYWFAFN